MPDYQFLSQEEQDEIIVEYLKAQERDHFCHRINLERFDAMLQSLPEGEFKNHIVNLREETAKRLIEVNSIIGATKRQLPPQERLDAAKARLAAKLESQNKTA